MMKRIALALALLAVSLLLLNAGCYTVLQHPTGGSVVQEGSYYRTCADCHADATYYHPYGRSYSRYGRSHRRWNSYNGSPWWYDDYWQWDPYDDHDYDHDYDAPEVETGTRHLWSSGGWPTRGWGSSTGSTRAPASEPIERDDKKKMEMKEKTKEKEKLKETEKEIEKEKEKRSPWKKPTGRRG